MLPASLLSNTGWRISIQRSRLPRQESMRNAKGSRVVSLVRRRRWRKGRMHRPYSAIMTGFRPEWGPNPTHGDPHVRRGAGGDRRRDVLHKSLHGRVRSWPRWMLRAEKEGAGHPDRPRQRRRLALCCAVVRPAGPPQRWKKCLGGRRGIGQSAPRREQTKYEVENRWPDCQTLKQRLEFALRPAALPRAAASHRPTSPKRVRRSRAGSAEAEKIERSGVAQRRPGPGADRRARRQSAGR